MSKKLTAHLMGGLGNQMFQYAAARAIANRNGIPLFLDDHSGFVRDTVYKRTYELGKFPIQAQIANFESKIQYLAEKIIEKVIGAHKSSLNNRFLWTVLEENQLRYIDEISKYKITKNTLMHGYWQTEKYFEDIKELIALELMPLEPAESKFLEYGQMMDSCNSISLGVRLFEEVPGGSKEGVGGLTDISFFNESAKKLSKELVDPQFFVFCTTNSVELEKLQLPGQVHLITHDNGFHGTLERLWLYTKCKNHIIANSSFYWWGAWLSEQKNPNSKIIASPNFSNKDTIPSRWLSRLD